MPDDECSDRWSRDLAALVAAEHHAAVAAAFADLARRYGEAHRHYHTLDHVAAVLVATDALADAEHLPSPGAAAVTLAAWFHDVVYEVGRSDNEAISARVACEALSALGVDGAIVAETGRLIELTAHHEAAAGDTAGAVLLDADLSVLGAAPEVYDAYADAIRREYEVVPDDAYRAGRAAILQGFVVRPHLFSTATGRRRWDSAARANLRRELGRLTPTGVVTSP